jgi:hypothetical protein
MDHLPRPSEIKAKSAPKGPRKPRAPRPVGADAIIKGVAKQVMNNIADAADSLKMTVEPVEKPSGRTGVKITIG